MAQTRFLEHEKPLSLGPPSDQTHRAPCEMAWSPRHASIWHSLGGPELPHPSLEAPHGIQGEHGTFWWKEYGNTRPSGNCWESPQLWGRGLHFSPQSADLSRLEDGPALCREAMRPAAALWAKRAQRLRGEAAVLETLLGPCFPRVFVTKDILFQIPTPHLRSSSLSVRRQSFFPSPPARLVGTGQVGLAWQRVGC